MKVWLIYIHKKKPRLYSGKSFTLNVQRTNIFKLSADTTAETQYDMIKGHNVLCVCLIVDMNVYSVEHKAAIYVRKLPFIQSAWVSLDLICMDVYHASVVRVGGGGGWGGGGGGEYIKRLSANQPFVAEVQHLYTHTHTTHTRVETARV